MEKRGQISIFIIISLIVIGVIIGFFVLKNTSFNIFSSDISLINNHIESCLEESLFKSLKFFGTQGVVYNVNPEDSKNLSYFNIPYYYYEGENRLLPITEIEEILKDYVKSYSDECLDNLEKFEEQGYKIEKGEKELLVEIKNKEIKIYLEYPLKIIKGKEVTNLDNFEAEVDFDFMGVYRVLDGFIREQDKNPDYVPIGYIGVLSYEENIEVYITDFSIDTEVYTLVFNDAKLLDEPYVLSFGIKYDWSELYSNEKDEG